MSSRTKRASKDDKLYLIFRHFLMPDLWPVEANIIKWEARAGIGVQIACVGIEDDVPTGPFAQDAVFCSHRSQERDNEDEICSFVFV